MDVALNRSGFGAIPGRVLVSTRGLDEIVVRGRGLPHRRRRAAPGVGDRAPRPVPGPARRRGHHVRRGDAHAGDGGCPGGPRERDDAARAFAWTGDPATGEETIRAIRSVAAPLVDTVGVIPYQQIGAVHEDADHPMPIHTENVEGLAPIGRPGALPDLATGPDRARRACPEDVLGRLRAVAERYDPSGVLHAARVLVTA